MEVDAITIWETSSFVPAHGPMCDKYCPKNVSGTACCHDPTVRSNSTDGTCYKVKSCSDISGGGGSWTRTCSNQTSTKVCDCEYLTVSGDPPWAHQDPRGWTFDGEATIDGEPCTNWLVAPSIVWSVSNAKPNLLLRAVLTGGPGGESEQSFYKYLLEPPHQSRWIVPTAWNCSKYGPSSGTVSLKPHPLQSAVDGATKSRAMD
jgi:hypothetical protein